MIPSVRLTPDEIEKIIKAFKHHFSSQDHLWLFGSRVDLNKRGGDIDFYIETLESDINTIVNKKMDFVNELWQTLGDQQIDVVVNLLPEKKHLPIYEIAQKTGVQLV